jgi:hypothetical protein
MMQGNQQALPVDPVNINSAAIFHSPTPQNLPFWPQVTVSTQAQSFVPMIMAHLIGAIQSNAMKNPIRIFSFNYLSQYGYNNQTFLKLLEDTVSYFDLMMTFTQNGRPPDPNTAATQAAAEYATIMAALLVRSFPSLASYQSPDMIQDMNARIQLHERVQQQIQQVQSNRSTNNQPVQHVQQGGYGQAPGYNPADALRGADGMTPFERVVKGGHNPTFHDLMQPPPGTASAQLFSAGPVATTQEDMGIASGGLSPRTNAPPTVLMTEVDFDQDTPVIKTVELPPAHLEPEVIPLPDPVHVVNLAEPDVFAVNQPVLAAQSGLKPTTLCRLVYDPTVYDPCYQQMPDGSVTMMLSTRSEEMQNWDYKEHELDQSGISDQLPPDNPNAPPVGLTTEGLESVKRTERDLAELHDRQEQERRALAEASKATEEADPDIEITAPVQTLTSTLFTHSHREAGLIASIARLRDSEDQPIPREYFYRVIKPMLFVSSKTTVKINDLLRAPSYDTLFVDLPTLLEGRDKAIWAELNSRLTAGLNHVLNAELGIEGWSITSFAEDYGDLLDALSKSVYSADFIQTIEGTASAVIAKALEYLTDAEQEEYINGLIQLGSDIQDEAANKLIALSEYCSMTELPISSQDLSPFLENGILPTKAVAFHRIVKGLVENGLSMGKGLIPRTFITLMDGPIFEVHTSQLVEDVYVLRPVASIENF